ncbi:hypothetical protein [Saccharicrinis fermentans]|uniref:Uncharacterized protein n=1 Tax=Saccharicrinis fermentans DSM 9555 = JCM 21142 TaxID=869213 RepID=W7YBP5_9BACT|nr:hypothetical protein [Saccharicrinis fermentans]GAF05847.1 hypothetical protein JCM21142_114601 [Saccharicrinis fermentans DSM 9555 = JCM 21142]
MTTITDDIIFDPDLSYEEQSEAFLTYAQEVFATIDFTDMSDLVDDTCTWTVEQDGLKFTATRVYINVKWYTVKSHTFSVEEIEEEV